MNGPLKIKICGLKDEQSLTWAIEAGADMVGFVHFAKSPRHLEIKAIAELIAVARGRVEPRVQTVVLLVNPDDELVKQISALKPDLIQLHGSESVERVSSIRKLSNTKIIKVLPVATAEDLSDIKAFAAMADRVLLDARPPENASRPGGLGKVFDWDLLKRLDPEIVFVLSGGLNPDNVGTAIGAVAPWGIDVSSGVESAPGMKDKNLIRAFIGNARAAGNAENTK